MKSSKNNKIKVLVAMSGGVDSSVTAALLVGAGYSVTGAYMLNYDNNKPGSDSCWLPDYRDALRVAAHLGIPLLRLDFTKEYKEAVLDYMFREYEARRTPNPDVLCNTFVKFGSWLEKAKELGFDYLATGHYAKVKVLSSEFGVRSFQLMCSKDENKDQTYFLHQLNQEQLSRTMFPIGGYTKDQVRKLAKKFRLPTAEKEESMGICFVGEVPMDEFLKTKIKPKPGNIVLSDGTVLGKHEGLSFYTIGQRHLGALRHPGPPAGGEGSKSDNRLDSSATPQNDNRPLYVVEKRADTNELVVGFEDDELLYKQEIALDKPYWTSGQGPVFPLKCEVRLRHRQELQKCTVEEEGGGIKVVFDKPQRAVTPGQFAVFYKKGECLGGAVVK